MVPDHSPEDASPPEPSPGGCTRPSEVSVSDQSPLSSGWGPILEGTCGGGRDACRPESPSVSSSELNGGVLPWRRKEGCMGQKGNFKSQTSPPANMFGLSRASPAPSLGPNNKQPGITLECGGYTSFPLEGEDPALSVWQAGLGEELLKRGQVCSGQEQRTPVSSWGLRIPPVHFCLCPSPVRRSQQGAQHRCCLRWGATTQAQ